MPQDYFDNIGEHGTFIIDEPPDGPDTCLAFSDNSKTTQLTSGERYYYENPFFVWNSAIDSAGIAGYAVSFCGSQYDTVDVSNFQTDTTYTANNLYPGMTYYLRVRAKDNSGIWNEARTLFIYIYGDPVTLADTPWPKFKGDSKNTGQSSYLGPKTNNVKWQFKTTFYLHSSSPVVGCDGTIYIGSYDSTLYAINPDGSEKWLFNTGGSVFSPPLIGSDGTIYFGSYDTNLYAINSDGDKKWQFSTDHPVLSSPSIGSDGIVYVGTYYGPTYYNLYAINPDGSEKWRFNIGAATFSSPSIGSDGTIYIGSLDYNLYSINPDGSEKWRFSAGSSITSSSSSIGNDGTIYIGSNDNNLYAISPDGSEKWRFMTGGSIRSSSAIDNDGVIYIGSNDNNLYAINPDGSEKWRFSTTGMIYSSPTIGSDGIIYIGSYDSTLYAINPDGSEKWKFKTEGRISSSPAIDKNGTLYIGSFDSTLYAFQDLDEEGPLVVLNTPNGGETLYCDGEYEIRWEATDNITVSNIALYYSVDNGISYIPIDTTELNDSSYTWIIPNTPSNKCKVKIIARDGVGNTGFDISDGTFIIADTTRPFVQVTSPNGGEMFGIGLTDTIKYSISDNVEIDFSQIYYSIDNGVSFELIDSISGTSDEYIWEVPLAFSNECFIKIIAIDNSGNSNEDVSDLPFIITDLSDPAVTLISPVGGEEYVGSLDYDIQWNASDNYKLDKAYFYFSLNNGETFSVVDSTNAVNTSYRWTVPDIHSDICQLAIIVKDSVGNVASDTTKDVFKIGRGPTAMLTTPNTEQSGDISIVYQLWDKQGDTLSFTPYYSINSGVNWTIATVDGNTSNIDSLHYNNSIVWKSETDLPHNEIYTVRFKIIPSDTALGIGGQTSDFHLDNNEIPSVILTEILDVVTITIPIYYELSDSEKDTLNILVEYFNKEESVFKTATLIDEQTNLTENQYSGKLYWRSDLDCPEISDNILFRITPFDNDTGVSDTIVIIVDNFRSRMSIDWIYGEQTGDIPLNYRITNDTLSTVSITYQYGSSLTNTWYLATINGDVTDINYHNYTGTHIWQSAIDLPGEDISNIQIRAMPFDVRGGVEFISHDIHIDNNNVPVVDTIFTPQAEVTGDVELRFGIKDDESDTLDYDIQYSIDSGNSWQHPSLNFLYQHIPPENDTLSFTWLSNDDIPNLDLNTIKFKIIPMDNDTGIIGESGIFHVDNETGPVILSSFPKVYALWQDTIIIDFDRSINATTLSGNLLVSGSRSGDITGSDIFLNDYHSLFFMPDNPFMADETISVVLKAGLSDNLGKGLDGDNDGDPEGSPTDDYSWQFTSPYLGDYDNSDVVDVQDLIIFAEKWQQEKQDMLFEIGPAIGELPYLELEPDSIIDFEDFVTLARMWNYSVGTAELLAMFTNENDEELISQPSLAKQADPSITKPAKEILDYETKSIIKKDPKVKQTVSKHPVISLNPKISDDPWANSKNGSFEVEVKLDELIDVSGAQLVFQYDKDLLNFDGFLKTPENEQPMSKSLAKTLMSQEINNISNLNVGTDKLIMQHAEENVVLLDIV
ncbi:PQQ-binding-like beta-propeller repeat protein, partial [bacterium]|nr:PQQ-binding-like beta-propeller repeat protein [bacterium]